MSGQSQLVASGQMLLAAHTQSTGLDNSSNLDDEHVWQGLLDGRAEVWFIGDRDSASTLTQHCGDNRVSHLGEYFAPSLASLVSRVRLLS